MKNIIRSVLYEAVRSRMLIRLFLVMVAMQCLVTFLNLKGTDLEDQLLDQPSLFYMYAVYMAAIVVALVCGSDYTDKVANYEILQGHSRLRIFLARSVCASLLAAFMGLVLVFCALLTGLAVSGWKGQFPLSDLVLRMLLMFFPLFRYAAFLCCISYLIRNHYVLMGIGIGFLPGAMDLLRSLSNDPSYMALSYFNLGSLLEITARRTYSLDPESGVVAFTLMDGRFSPGFPAGTILASLLGAALYLAAGYGVFRRDDMN